VVPATAWLGESEIAPLAFATTSGMRIAGMSSATRNSRNDRLV
jgi:hypothetical protein